MQNLLSARNIIVYIIARALRNDANNNEIIFNIIETHAVWASRALSVAHIYSCAIIALYEREEAESRSNVLDARAAAPPHQHIRAIRGYRDD